MFDAWPQDNNDHVKMLTLCPICGSNQVDLKTIHKNGINTLVHVKCRDCYSTVLAILFVSKAGVASIALRTDLSFQDALRFETNQEVTVDEILEVHEAVNSTGFFRQLSG